MVVLFYSLMSFIHLFIFLLHSSTQLESVSLPHSTSPLPEVSLISFLQLLVHTLSISVKTSLTIHLFAPLVLQSTTSWNCTSGKGSWEGMVLSFFRSFVPSFSLLRAQPFSLYFQILESCKYIEHEISPTFWENVSSSLHLSLNPMSVQVYRA